jgi:ribosomal protein S1
MTKKKPIFPDEEATILHTDMENNPDTGVGSEDGAEELKNAPMPQTDSKKEVSDEAATIEPESAPVKKPGRKRKKTTDESESDDTPVSTPEAAVPAASKPKKRRSVKLVQEVISIDDERTVETDEDKEKNDLLDLTESLKAGRILTGTVQGVEKTSDDAIAVIYHGAYKIIIPTSEAVAPPNDYRDMSRSDVHEYLLMKRLGAEFDYVIKGIDPKAKIAVASRLEAMKAKRRIFYNNTDTGTGRRVREGTIAEARVVSVIRTGIFVDLFGVETFIPLKELSYQRIMDAKLYYQTGQRVLVKVLGINIVDKNTVEVEASVKQTTENPSAQALRKYSVGSKYVGTVSLVDTTGVFVALDGGIDCLCAYPKRGRPPRGARVTVMILGINQEANRIWGAIIHTALTR